MKATEFTGHTAEIRALKPTPWLASEDILGKGPVEVTIETCHKVKDAVFDAGRKEDVFTLSFVGKEKQLVLNATNRKALVNMFGPHVPDWKGKKIKIAAVKVRGIGGVQTYGIRVVNEATDNQSRE